MRLHRVLLVLTALVLPLALAAPAMAADHPVRVVDFEFLPGNVAVDVGDTVTWTFVNGGHTTTSAAGQPDSWNSAPAENETNRTGDSFQKQFTVPGRYSYICIPHRTFMKGAVVVGEDRFAKSYSRFKQVRRGSRITFRFTLVEPAKVVARLRGPSRRSVTKRRLLPGSHSIAFRNLRNGAYQGAVDFTDDFDKLTRVKTSTVIR
jgi:plastocyanin